MAGSGGWAGLRWAHSLLLHHRQYLVLASPHTGNCGTFDFSPSSGLVVTYSLSPQMHCVVCIDRRTSLRKTTLLFSVHLPHFRLVNLAAISSEHIQDISSKSSSRGRGRTTSSVPCPCKMWVAVSELVTLRRVDVR